MDMFCLFLINIHCCENPPSVHLPLSSSGYSVTIPSSLSSPIQQEPVTKGNKAPRSADPSIWKLQPGRGYVISTAATTIMPVVICPRSFSLLCLVKQ